MCTSKFPNVSTLGINININNAQVTGHTSVGILTRLRSGRSRKRGSTFDRGKKLFSSAKRPDLLREPSYLLFSKHETSFARTYSRRDVMLTTRLQYRGKICGTVPPTPVYLQGEHWDNHDYTIRYKTCIRP
jgi:hypothetical protein